MEDTKVWKSRPIFVTSTFQDMQAERDHLMQYVFPALEEWLIARRRHLEWVDLRVGVATANTADESKSELMVLKVCLDEVRRSRPFIIGLLGDRYGWVPPTDRMAAAITEAGFDTSVEGRSVTDLEIEYGVFADIAESNRCLFFLRAPLPYEQMPHDVAARYCDAMATDPDASARSARLTELKVRLRQEVPERCIEYEAIWDSETQRVTNLSAWGQLVESRLRAALSDDFAEDLTPAEVTGSQVHDRALEYFVHDRARGFVGRVGTMDRLETIIDSPPNSEEPWGVCITGEPGSGKTAIFAEMINRLQSRQAVTLAHSPSVSSMGAWVGFMMQLFITKLLAHQDAVHLFRYTEEGEVIEKDLVDAVFAPHAREEHVYTLFGLLLSRMAERQRVVILIDALNQMEPISTARFLGWIKEHCPLNTRLLTTTVPGEASAVLCSHPDIELHPLPPLDEQEATSIVDGIHARYHRNVEASVLNAIIAKNGPDNAPWSIPLWLVIATEELNLLDADDFSRAARDYHGRDDERLAALMCDLIGEMPSSVQKMYRAGIVRAESIFGSGLVTAFLGTIHAGRFGWREIDFRELLPKLSGEPWDELRFASLRRLFRGHLRRREPSGQWDFNHGQMRMAIRSRMAELEVEEPKIHAAIANHLLTLPANDPVRADEVMLHLLAAEDLDGAARYLGSDQLDQAGAMGASRVMADMIRSSSEPTQAANTLTLLLEAKGIDAVTLSRIAGHLLTVHVQTQGRSSIASEEALLVPLERCLEQLAFDDPENRLYLKQHSNSLMWLGNLHRDQGELESSIKCFRRAEDIQSRIAASDSANENSEEQTVGPSLNLGDALYARGDLDGALAIFSHPAHAESSAAHCRIGNVLRMRNDLDGALESYGTGIEILNRELQDNPTNQPAQMNLGIALSTIGSTLLQKEDFDGALEFFRRAEAIMASLATKNPAEPHLKFEWSLMHFRIGQALLAISNHQGARDAFFIGIPILERIATQHPENASYLYHLSLFNLPLGDILLDEGDIDGALVRWREASTVLEQLVARDSENAEWKKSLDAAQSRIRHATRLGDSPREATHLGARSESGHQVTRHC